MKLFENKVGRPSNEVLKKRKLFKIGVVLGVVVLLGIVFSFSFLGTSNLKGTSYAPGTEIKLSKTKVYISAKSKIYIKRSGNFYIWNSDVSNGRIRVTKYKNRVGKKGYVSGWIKTSAVNINETVDRNVISNYSPGDVDMNGKVEATDSRLILQYTAGLKLLNTNQLSLADVNKDKKVTAVDARIVLQYVAGIIEVPTIEVKPAITITEYNDVWNTGSSRTVTVTLGDSSDTYSVKTSNKWVMSITNQKKESFTLNAIKEGKATITVTSNKTGESISREYSVRKETNTTIKAIKMGVFENGLKIGSVGTASVSLADSNDSFTVTTSNPKVMMVKAVAGNKIELKPIYAGSATITVTSTKTGQTDSYTYNVEDYKLPDISRFGANKTINYSETINGIPIYVESSCSSANVKAFKADIKNLASYAARPIRAIYIVKKNSFATANPSSKDAAGLNYGAILSYTDIMCESYSPTTIFHEAGHAMDYRYKGIVGNQLSESLQSLYNTYKPWSKGDPLREYSYTNKEEFWADSYATYLGKTSWSFPQNLKDTTKLAIDKVLGVTNW